MLWRFVQIFWKDFRFHLFLKILCFFLSFELKTAAKNIWLRVTPQRVKKYKLNKYILTSINDSIIQCNKVNTGLWAPHRKLKMKQFIICEKKIAVFAMQQKSNESHVKRINAKTHTTHTSILKINVQMCLGLAATI